MTQTILTLARFSILEAIRTRTATLALALLGVGIVLAWFLGQVAVTETREIQAVLTASFLRLVAVFVLAAFVITAQAREMADKGIDMLLSLPTSRSAYYLGKLTGYLGSAWLLSLVFGAALLPVATVESVVAWTASLGFELSLVAAASLFFATTLTNVPATMAALAGFYLLSRAMAALQLIGGSSLINDGSAMPVLAQRVLDILAAVLPRLDLFTQSAWLTQPSVQWSLLSSVALQAAIYFALLSAAGLIDLYRKNF